MSVPEPGPLAEEAAKLVDAVWEWVERTLPEPERHSATSATGAIGAPECRYCPLCQAIAALRGERPEMTARVADALIAAAGVFGALAQSLARPVAAEPPDRPAAGPPAVHRIDLDADPGEPG